MFKADFKERTDSDGLIFLAPISLFTKTTSDAEKMLSYEKIIIVFALVLIVTMVCPFSALAEETEPVLTYDELINLSCSAFPEYEDNIRNPQINPVRAYSLEDPVVISESS